VPSARRGPSLRFHDWDRLRSVGATASERSVSP
jgi:hypothetical protein